MVSPLEITIAVAIVMVVATCIHIWNKYDSAKYEIINNGKEV